LSTSAVNVIIIVVAVKGRGGKEEKTTALIHYLPDKNVIRELTSLL
jgi:hypothetical protein